MAALELGAKVASYLAAFFAAVEKHFFSTAAGKKAARGDLGM